MNDHTEDVTLRMTTTTMTDPQEAAYTAILQVQDDVATALLDAAYRIWDASPAIHTEFLNRGEFACEFIDNIAGPARLKAQDKPWGIAA